VSRHPDFGMHVAHPHRCVARDSTHGSRGPSDSRSELRRVHCRGCTATRLPAPPHRPRGPHTGRARVGGESRGSGAATVGRSVQRGTRWVRVGQAVRLAGRRARLPSRRGRNRAWTRRRASGPSFGGAGDCVHVDSRDAAGGTLGGWWARRAVSARVGVGVGQAVRAHRVSASDRRARTAMASDADRQLCNAARVGSVADVDRLIAAGADPNAFLGGFHYSPLLDAAHEGRCDTAAALLRAGALVDGSNADGLTALMLAAKFGHTTMVDALLGAGADASRACDNGDTSLHFSCRRGHQDTMKALLEAGARTDLRNSRGRRPFQVVRACVSCRVVACGRT
jgi:hypothetical protein